MIRVMIVAPSLVLRLGLRQMLQEIPGIAISGEAASPAEFRDMDSAADVILLASAARDWFTTGEAFAHGPASLLLSDDNHLIQAFYAGPGTWGVLPADPTHHELAAGIQALYEGLVVLPAYLAKRMVSGPDSQNSLAGQASPEPLTAREGEILGLVAHGLANKQIAAKLGISEHTVKFHLSSLFAKLGANSRTEAVRLGTQQGLIGI